MTVVRIPTLWRAIRHRKDEQESFRESLRRTFEEELSTTKTANVGSGARLLTHTYTHIHTLYYIIA